MRQEVTATSVSGGVRCVECGEVASGPATGWKAYLAGGFEDDPLEVVVFCPECAFRELGTAATAS
jgi:DNA-directed RNA polymerase subunit RPC12/RpoP